MEFLLKHLRHLPRKFCSPMPINIIGFLPHKKDRMICDFFSTFNFSFILEGTGTYIYHGEVYNVKAPCVVTECPGELMDYGPDTSWYEIFLSYPSSSEKFLKKRNFFKQGRPIWHISNPDNVLKLVVELKAALAATPIVADRVDLICEAMIVESLLAKATPPQTAEERKIRLIKSYIRDNFTVKHDYARLAGQYGMALSTFRRHWLKYIGIPPAKYQSNLIIQEACRLLIENDETIKEIAEMLNFQDPFYFSKKFHMETGFTPTQYRNQYSRFPI